MLVPVPLVDLLCARRAGEFGVDGLELRGGLLDRTTRGEMPDKAFAAISKVWSAAVELYLHVRASGREALALEDERVDVRRGVWRRGVPYGEQLRAFAVEIAELNAELADVDLVVDREAVVACVGERGSERLARLEQCAVNDLMGFGVRECAVEVEPVLGTAARERGVPGVVVEGVGSEYQAPVDGEALALVDGAGVAVGAVPGVEVAGGEGVVGAGVGADSDGARCGVDGGDGGERAVVD